MKKTTAQRQLAALIEEAMKQPGIVDVMRLYEPTKLVTDEVDQVQRAISPTWVTSCSNSSVK